MYSSDWLLGFSLLLGFQIPVPLVVPASQEPAQPSSTKGSVPSQSSMEDEDVEKSKSRPLSHAGIQMNIMKKTVCARVD